MTIAGFTDGTSQDVPLPKFEAFTGAGPLISAES